MLKYTLCALILSAGSATADLTVRFEEGAPKDRFTLTNTGDCPLPQMAVLLDLGTAPAGLIFDTTGGGAGVQVFQPFELVAGAENLMETPRVQDGDSAIQLTFVGLGEGQSLAFTIDIDDTGGGREITVSGSEIAGATVQVDLGGQRLTAPFGDDARATLPLASCLS